MTIKLSAGTSRGKRSLAGGLLLLAFTFLFHAQLHAQCSQLVWNDEFDGTTLDLTKWSYQIGNGTNDGLPSGWGNQERQYYTSRANNISVTGGNLVITARAENYLGANYTSARIRSTNTTTFNPANQWHYGAIEARILLPTSPTNGASKIWPAFWMLPDNGPWPNTGEIDIVETGLESNPGHYNGTLHYWQGSHAQAGTGAQNLGNLSTAFHVYRVDWGPNSIRFSVDGVQVGATLTNASTGTNGVIGAGNWPFDNATNPYHVILNLAVGGYFPGTAAPNNSFYPMQMLVDYVRVYSSPSAVTINGKSKVMQGQTGVVYSVANQAGNTYNWTVPAGATITAGQATNQITVTYGAAAVSGNVSVTITPSGGGCVASTINKPVSVLANACTITLEDFEGAATRNLGFNFSTGWMNRPTPASASNPFGTFANPNTTGNPSAFVGKYERNGGLAYDVVAYNDIAVGDPAVFRNGVASFQMLINTNAPVGTTIMVQLENKDLAQTGWPNGIYTRFTAVTASVNTWHTLNFTYLDGPDAVMPASQVDQLIIFFGVGSAGGVGGLTGNTSTYYWDNFRRVGTTPNTSAITGVASVCQNNTGQIYSVTGLPGSTYNWTTPTGGSVASGQGTNTATINFGTTSGNVSVVETSSINCVGPTRNRAVTVSGSCVLIADFAATPTTSCLGADVVFTDLTSGKTGGETYNWNFGAGASLPAGTTGAGPFNVTYSTSGTKTVTLTVTKGATNDTETKTNYITILPAPSGCLMADDFNNNALGGFVAPIPGAFSHAESGTNWTITNGGYSEWQNWTYTLNNGTVAAPINFACSLNQPTVKIRARTNAGNAVLRIQMLDGTGLGTDNVPGFNIELTPTSTFYTINYRGALRNFYSPTPGYLDTTNITQLQFFVNPGYISYPVVGVNGTYNSMFTGSVIIDWIGIGDATCGDPLPVELLFLKAKKTDAHTVQLHWATAMEKDNSHFEIRRSTDGTNFSTIATQKGAGNSTQTLDYYFNDEHLLNAGKYYYQLNQVDFDGSNSFSQVVAVNFNPDANVDVIPNIVNAGQNIQVKTYSSEALTITLMDLNGKILIQKSNTQEREISTNGLSAGMFLVQVVDGESVITKRVVIQ